MSNKNVRHGRGEVVHMVDAFVIGLCVLTLIILPHIIAFPLPIA